MDGPEAVDRLARRRLTTAERRSRIAEAAAAPFDRAGYSNTSMEDVAAEVGLAEPTLYHDFPGKDALLLEIHEELNDLLTRQHAEPVTSRLGGHGRVFFEHHRELPDAARAASPGSSATPTTPQRGGRDPPSGHGTGRLQDDGGPGARRRGDARQAQLGLTVVGGRTGPTAPGRRLPVLGPLVRGVGAEPTR